MKFLDAQISKLQAEGGVTEESRTKLLQHLTKQSNDMKERRSKLDQSIQEMDGRIARVKALPSKK